MMTNQSPKPIRHRWIAHGSDWAEFEDLLIGDRDGLKALRQAVDEALTNGEGNLGDIDSQFLAVRVVDKHPDQGKGKASIGWLVGTCIILVATFGIVCLIYGFIRLPDLFK